YKSESENIKLRVEQDKKNKDLLAQQTKELPELKNKHETLSGETEQTKQQVKNLQEEYDTQISGHQRLLFELEKTREAKQTLESISSKLKESETQTEILNRLKTMFGRDGIPNRILEGVVPQLEEVANNILERISRGRHGSESMRLLFELKRETATGKRNAALDIILSDGENRRPYELFSGGERFRADFAIRLALSHILSQRSGRRLRTLVVDEGFGTQDAEGVGALVEAIHDVSSDFERVLVVSHVEEIKNSFEGQISVWRDGEGSHFTVR
ncbi:MAG TPA: SMC family ATPase, partial [Caldisericia bacterium]|nr:SMC family ATPase [Caldisericia bacterium]